MFTGTRIKRIFHSIPIPSLYHKQFQSTTLIIILRSPVFIHNFTFERANGKKSVRFRNCVQRSFICVQSGCGNYRRLEMRSFWREHVFVKNAEKIMLVIIHKRHVIFFTALISKQFELLEWDWSQVKDLLMKFLNVTYFFYLHLPKVYFHYICVSQCREWCQSRGWKSFAKVKATCRGRILEEAIPVIVVAHGSRHCGGEGHRKYLEKKTKNKIEIFGV